MNRAIVVFVVIGLASIMLAFVGCGHTPLEYNPDLISDPDPLATIEEVILRQPPSYQPVNSVEATEEYLQVRQLESGYGPYDRSHSEVTRTMYWVDIQAVKLFKDKVWWAAIYDKSGEISLYVYPIEEKLTKRFVDAVSIMMKKAKETT